MTGFIGKANFLPGQVIGKSVGEIKYIVSIAEWMELVCRAAQTDLTPGQQVTVLIRPERLQLSAKTIEGANILRRTLDSRVFLCSGYDCRLTVHGHALRSLATTSCDAEVGKDVYVRIDDALVIGDASALRQERNAVPSGNTSSRIL